MKLEDLDRDENQLDDRVEASPALVSALVQIGMTALHLRIARLAADKRARRQRGAKRAKVLYLEPDQLARCEARGSLFDQRLSRPDQERVYKRAAAAVRESGNPLNEEALHHVMSLGYWVVLGMPVAFTDVLMVSEHAKARELVAAVNAFLTAAEHGAAPMPFVRWMWEVVVEPVA